MKRGKGHGSVRCIIGGLAVFAAVQCIGCQAGSSARGKTVLAVGKNTDEGTELTAYQEFLDGSRSGSRNGSP